MAHVMKGVGGSLARTFPTLSALLGMTDGFAPLLPFARAALLGRAGGFVLFGVAAGVFVDDVGAHVEGLLRCLVAHVASVRAGG